MQAYRFSDVVTLACACGVSVAVILQFQLASYLPEANELLHGCSSTEGKCRQVFEVRTLVTFVTVAS